jgi:SanA protein
MRKQFALRLVAMLVMAALVILAGAGLWVRFSTAGYLYDDARAVPSREVALVLGASVFRSGKPSPVVEDRLRACRALLEAGKVSRILVSGDHQPDQYDEVEAMRAWLRRDGVPEAKIVIDKGGQRTFDSVVRAEALFGARSVIVCTQAFHLPRAVYLARRAGIDAVGLKTGGGLSAAGLYNLGRESLATVRGVIEAMFLHPATQVPTPAATSPPDATVVNGDGGQTR